MTQAVFPKFQYCSCAIMVRGALAGHSERSFQVETTRAMHYILVPTHEMYRK